MLYVFNHYAITFVPKVFINIVLIKFAIIHLCFDNVFPMKISLNRPRINSFTNVYSKYTMYLFREFCIGWLRNKIEVFHCSIYLVRIFASATNLQFYGSGLKNKLKYHSFKFSDFFPKPSLKLAKTTLAISTWHIKPYY